ncbi:MAG TPA: 4-hydroxythreonine-4-phosphate dehydrogenase PdxA [Vicinamibacterales bacterium]|nr:4-hydroxythreonine-4-phosphate dehydrogenase PdxA [Vicinamibacterales bacterium]
MSGRPLVAITTGDPSGIGPEICAKAIRDPRVVLACRPVLYGPQSDADVAAFPVGRVDAAAGRAAYDSIVAAVDDVRAGRADALVTAPINKEAFAAAGLDWKGHTDLLAHLCGVKDVAMMFWSERLRVVLATVHVALRDVPAALTESRLLETIRLTAKSVPRFGLAAPRIGVAGLNPHAGEGGLMGREEEDVIRPAIAKAAADGITVSGPFPADTLFVRAARGEFDVVVAAYHDQGLVPVKLLAFGRAVNVTLGLPIVRTSVDHGTAFDIARQGVADEGSLVEAILLATRLAQ